MTRSQENKAAGGVVRMPADGRGYVAGCGCMGYSHANAQAHGSTIRITVGELERARQEVGEFIPLCRCQRGR